MSKVYFIDRNYLLNNTTINLNVDDKLLNSSINMAQAIYIQDVLGTKLYNKLETLIIDGTIGGVGNEYYKTLLDDYVKMCAAMWTLYKATTYIRYKIMNRGLVSQNSENSNPAELNEVIFIQNDVKENAEFLTKRITDYICANITHFPEYSQNNVGDIQPSDDIYFCGMVLDDDNWSTSRWLGYNDGNKKIW